jgi:hypothetical protein
VLTDGKVEPYRERFVTNLETVGLRNRGRLGAVSIGDRNDSD